MEQIESFGLMAFLLLLLVMYQLIGPFISTCVQTIYNFLI
jgi:hypothetical protein